MAYKTILVHVADDQRAERLIAAVLPLAARMGSHLVGLSVMPPMVVVPSADGVGTSMTIDAHRQAYGSIMARSRDIFTRMTAPHAIASEWREADAGFSSVATTCLEHARTSDLVVLAQRDDRWAYAAHVEEPDRVAIGAGRPVLVLPTTTVSQLPPKRATVAWNGGREAARALFDALPLLADTEAVEILSIDPRPDGRGSDLPGTDLAVTLARHGLKADVSTSTSGSDGAGAEIARRAAAFGSDLVVMGCYGHSRLREFVLGGASRHMLAHAKLPVLMSH